jgi:hypothetical protein
MPREPHGRPGRKELMEHEIKIDVATITDEINMAYNQKGVDATSRSIFANGFTCGVRYGMKIARQEKAESPGTANNCASLPCPYHNPGRHCSNVRPQVDRSCEKLPCLMTRQT